MSHLMRRPLRGLRLLIATAMLTSFAFAAPVTVMAETNDTLPGVTAPGSPFTASVEATTGGDPRDVYSFTLADGQFLHVDVTQTSDATASVALFGPGTAEPPSLASALSAATLAGPGAGFTHDVTHAGQAGEYYLDVSAVSGDSTFTVTYTLGTPSFSLDSPGDTISVTQGASTADRQVTATWTDVGSVPVTFTAESDQTGWLNVTPGSGQATTGGTRQFNVSVDTPSLAIGEHQGTITVSVPGATPQTYVVTVTVGLPPHTPEDNDTAPGVALPPSPFSGSVGVGASGDPRDVYKVSLTEGQFLDVEVAQTSDATASVALFGPGTTDVTDLSSALSTATLGPSGTYAEAITAHAGKTGEYYLSVAAVSGDSTYGVTYAVGTPSFSLDSTSAAITVVKDQGAADLHTQAVWSNLGPEPVVFTTESDQSWLSATPATGTANTNTSQLLTVSANTATLAVGSHEGTITVRVPGATPKTYRVSVNVRAATAMTAWASNAQVRYGYLVTFKSTLKDAVDAKLPSKQVALQRSYNGSTWTTVTAPISATGDYSVALKVYQNSYFRWIYRGDTGTAPSVSPTKLVKSYAYLTRPAVPTRVVPGRSYTFSGILRPKHTAGTSPVRVQFQYYYRGKWRTDSYLNVRIRNHKDGISSEYRYADSYPKGVPRAWRVRAIHADANHVTTTTSWERYDVY